MAEFLAAPLSNAEETTALAALDPGLGYLLDEMKIDGDALSKWMRHERELYLLAPALRL